MITLIRYKFKFTGGNVNYICLQLINFNKKLCEPF